ncbi:MAG TPA: hypothetical protein DDW19_02955 [Anaerolineaceae bacterium]|nr:hypothetical protein [Anaerolineaceae bacterium]
MTVFTGVGVRLAVGVGWVAVGVNVVVAVGVLVANMPPNGLPPETTDTMMKMPTITRIAAMPINK